MLNPGVSHEPAVAGGKQINRERVWEGGNMRSAALRTDTWAEPKAFVPRQHRRIPARNAQLDEVLSPIAVLRLLESSIGNLERAAASAPVAAALRITGVTYLDRPVVRGEIGATLKAEQEIHLLDASSGEHLGAAIVNDRHWLLEDTRVLSPGQCVAYVARLIDATGTACSVSNVYTYIAGEALVRSRSQNKGMPARINRESDEDVASSCTALIEEVAVEYPRRRRVQLCGRSASSRSIVDCRRTLTGTLSRPLLPGESVHILDNSRYIGQATVSGKTWEFCDARALRAGAALSYTAHVADPDGNLQPSTSVYLMTVGEPHDISGD